MFCSTIIPTIGRPSLGRAVESVLGQDLPGDTFEVIVVNDSGQPLREEAWQHSDKVRIIQTNRHNRSVARNTGAAIAKGRHLHFLDDDDWILPGTLADFWQLANDNPAAWLYGAFRLVDNAGKKVAEIFPGETGNCLMPLLAWEWLPIQASLIDYQAFFAVGGFDTLAPFSTIFQDVDLSRQIARHYQMARLDKVVCCIRIGEVSSTTSYSHMFVANRQSREKVLDKIGTFGRMLHSAHGNPTRPDYWHGKIVYYYLASAKWHMWHKRLFTAVSRTSYALSGLLLAGRHLFSANFWQGVLKPHYPHVGRALAEHEEDLFANTKESLTW